MKIIVTYKFTNFSYKFNYKFNFIPFNSIPFIETKNKSKIFSKLVVGNEK